MKLNVGQCDKIIRFVIAIVIFSAGVYFKSWWGLLGFLPFITASINWCPLYSALGISTSKPSE